MDDGYERLSLQELLCLKAFSTREGDRFNKLIAAWAEQEVMAGNSSEALLIVASLNLDTVPDRDEMQRYLSRYMDERQIAWPAWNLSALVWLRYQLGQLLASPSALAAEARLYALAVDSHPHGGLFFSRAQRCLNAYYYELFDDWGDEYPSQASAMSERQLLAWLAARIRPLWRVLSQPEWLTLLSRRG